MEREINQQRIRNIRKMLLEMASGNFDQRVPRTAEDDELESLSVLVNMLAEEMQESLFPKGYLNLHHLQYSPISLSFLVDTDFVIRKMSNETERFTGLPTENCEDPHFHSLLTDNCALNFEKLQKSILSNEGSSHLTLIYKTKNDTEAVALFSSIDKLNNSDLFVIHSIIPDTENELRENQNSPSERLPKTRRAEAKLMQQVYDYILAHLEAPLPSLKELSRLFGTNEYKLKEGFRHFFNSGIYQFYNDERLKRCHLLISETNIPLKQIAYMYGFNSYPSFSKAFKKKYGVAPYGVKGI